MWDHLALAAGLGATVVLSVIGGLFVLTILQKAQPNTYSNSIFREGEDATVFLFDEADLVDATPSALRLLTGSKFPDKPWYALMELLSPRFDNLEERLREVALAGSVMLSGSERIGGQPISLRAEQRGGLTKLTLVNPVRAQKPNSVDALTVHALDSELMELRDATNAAPFPIWRNLTSGEITWANAAYMDIICKVPAPDGVPDWPLRAMFDLGPAKGDVKGRPLRRQGPDKAGWFDVVTSKVSEGTVSFAMPADLAFAAESLLQDFKQTLTNTFAELSTGLAVFDHNRKLQLFNPALARLIDMPVEYLLKRPGLFVLLDAMRDNKLLPEPKDYKSWRHQMVDLESMSLRGEYRDTWYLPNGKAFRVVGRPYPNGALALMIDDITDEVVRNRLFRAELDIAMAVVNKIEEAVIVFSVLGQAVFANDRYRSLWGHDPVGGSKPDNGITILEKWRAQTAPSLFWSAVESALAGAPAVIPPQTIDMIDGQQLTCQVLPLADGGSCILFRQIEKTAGPKVALDGGRYATSA